MKIENRKRKLTISTASNHIHISHVIIRTNTDGNVITAISEKFSAKSENNVLLVVFSSI